MTIIEVLQDGVKDILPKEYAAQNTMYNYGCATLDALPDGRVIFSNKDEAVKILDPDTGDVAHVTGNPVLRYSDFNVNDANPWVLALEEDHTHDTPLETVNRIVAINTDDGSVRRIVQGSDFYYSPQFSHDGTKMAWLEWDHPDMAWFGARLLWAEFTKDGWAGERHLVAGGLLDGVAEPRWGPDGTLFFGREKDNYRQLFRLRPGDKSAAQVTGAGLELAEFGELTLMSGRCVCHMQRKTLRMKADLSVQS
jgi:outer membrane protein assembly factor BamB